jgi:demethylmenaquinone methyltransferase/2-methoxy-6-polyprenyl-1,4-benzoquinol methylase
VTAVDAVAEVLELNRALTSARPNASSLFEWEPPREFDVCFFGFWHSHVPSQRFEAFWHLVDRALNHRAGSSSSTIFRLLTLATPTATP